MPQFNFATFAGQIFWLLICFGILYYAISRIIIPRISVILDNRKQKIDIDSRFAKTLQKDIDETLSVANKLKDQSHDKYQKSIDNVISQCASDREKAINKAKKEINEMSINSRKEIEGLITGSQSEYKKISTNIADLVLKSIFGKKSDLTNKIEIANIDLKN
mgnify:CR=1 FL=1|jgi:F-type H+-transporting ATPase subunit b